MKKDSRLLHKGENQFIEAKQCTAINLAGTSRCEVFPDKITMLVYNHQYLQEHKRPEEKD